MGIAWWLVVHSISPYFSLHRSGSDIIRGKLRRMEGTSETILEQDKLRRVVT
jgi:hypothetical protein